jgi:Bacterial EndoU nuclease
MKHSFIVSSLLLLLLAALLPSAEARRSRSHGRGGEGERIEWSATDPPVNTTHIFEGQINKRGKPVGFHARPGGRNPANARVVRVLDGPNRAGVYTADVEIRDGGHAGSQWLGKNSTLYPDAMSRDEVIEAVLHAYRARTTGSGEKFRGPSGRGFTIEGYFQNGRINTAYPIFQR